MSNEVQTYIMDSAMLQQSLGLKGRFGKWVAGRLLKILEIDKVNSTHLRCLQYQGPDYAEAVLREVGVSYDYLPEQLDRIPAEGGFITVSNHPYGSLDGMILSTTIGRKRPDYKMLTTFMLTLIPNLRSSFLPVDNLSGKTDARSVNGIRMALRHIADGGAIGFFPAGEVATYQKEGRRTAVSDKPVIEDIPWAQNIIKLIRKSGLPVIPIYFDGANTRNFHRLGRIHPRLRTMRLVHEMFAHPGETVKMRIGQPIMPDDVKDMDLQTFGNYIRNRCYALEALCQENVPKADFTEAEPIAPPVDPALVSAEIERIKDRMLFESGDYRCYLSRPDDIPHTMKELARLREMVFRAIGEGTGKPDDTDEYDKYFHHLILWNIPDNRIAGAYRVGFGEDILAQGKGADGFYTASLFRFQKGLDSYLPHTMELGRTIILPEYQRDVQPLKLLLSGILTAAARGPHIAYTLGPASVSNDIPDFYKSLIVHFFRTCCSLPNAAQLATPTNPFKRDFLRVNPDMLLAGCKTVDDLDRLIVNLSDGKYRLPVLLRKYVSFGAHILDFNVDPLFHDSMDGLVLLAFTDMPQNTFNTFSKFLEPEEKEALRTRLYGNE